jgi:hypothetical protein
LYDLIILESIAKQTLPNGISTEYIYDNNNRIISIINRKSDQETISKYQYTYDACNNCTRAEEFSIIYGTKVTDYKLYNAFHQLKKIIYPSGAVKETEYDALNRLCSH